MPPGKRSVFLSRSRCSDTPIIVKLLTLVRQPLSKCAITPPHTGYLLITGLIQGNFCVYREYNPRGLFTGGRVNIYQRKKKKRKKKHETRRLKKFCGGIHRYAGWVLGYYAVSPIKRIKSWKHFLVINSVCLIVMVIKFAYPVRINIYAECKARSPLSMRVDRAINTILESRFS